MPLANYYLLSLLIGINLVACAFWSRRLRPGAERFVLFASMGGLCFYSGIGAAYVPVLWDYAVYYGIFAWLFGASYVCTVTAGRRIARGQRCVYERIDGMVEKRTFRYAAIGAYFTISLAPLLYPQFRLALVWHPPFPDLLAVLNAGVVIEQPTLLRISGYVGFLVWPFFLIALYSIRRNYLSLALCIATPLYFRYCASAYLGRSEVAMGLSLYLGVIWLDRPAFRFRMVALTLICIPFLLILFGIYGRIRLGDISASSMTSGEQIGSVLSIETSLPRSWNVVVNSGRHADPAEYITWLFTLPVPKVLTGEIRGARVNSEINEIVSSVSPGQEEFSYTLTGPVVESVYVYGMRCFWIHAVFVGGLAGLLCAFAAGSRSLLVVSVQFALVFGYVFSRGGIAALLPTLVNSYLSLYLLTFLLWSLGERRVTAGAGGFEFGSCCDVQGGN